MDKRMLHDEFSNIENDLKEMIGRLSEMKTTIERITEKNVHLELENKHLRARLIEIEELELEQAALANNEDPKTELSKSRMNLEKIYEEGFHVCNIYYGSRRENDEECAFCLDVIYGERERK